MSVKAMSWAFEKYVLDARAKLVLLALADHAADDGTCWPTIELIAVKSCSDRRSVFRKIIELEVAGLIARVQRQDEAGGQLATHYILNLKDLPPPILRGGGDRLSPGGGDTAVTRNEPRKKGRK